MGVPSATGLHSHYGGKLAGCAICAPAEGRRARCCRCGLNRRPSVETDRSLACCSRRQTWLLAWRLLGTFQKRGARVWSRIHACVGLVVALLAVAVASPLCAQGLGGAGTVQGTVKDPTGGVMQAVPVRISNPVSGFSRTATTDATGRYVFSN